MKTNTMRFFAAIMAITLLFTMSVGVSAATVPDAVIDTDRTGSIEIYKYDLTMANTNSTVANMLESYVSTGVRDTDLEAVMDDGTVNDLGNGQQSYGYAIKGVEFSYLKIGDICTYSETEDDGVHRDLVLYKMDDTMDAALLSALGLTNSDAYPVVGSYAEPGCHFFTSDTLIDALSAALASNATTVKNALESYMAEQNAGKFDETDAHGHTSKDDLPLGLYLIVETKVPEMVVSTCNPFFVSVPMTTVNGTNADNGGEEWLYDVTLYPKNETGIPSLEKTVREAKEDTGKEADSTGYDGIDNGYEHNATGSDNDMFQYQIISKLPAITSETTALTVYTFVDTLSNGLEYLPDYGVQIHWFTDADCTDEIDEWISGEDTFTVEYGTAEDDATTMTIAMTEEGLDVINHSTEVYGPDGVHKGYSECYIRISYTCRLNADDSVVYGDDGNPNTVVLTWQRSNMSYYDTLVDDCHVYTYVLEITKEFSDGRGDFSKVNFKAQNSTDGYWLVARMENDGEYYVTDHVSDEADGTVFVPNGSTGVLRIYGVEDDTYVLTETQTDNGYTLLKDHITVVITAEENESRPCGIYDTDVLGLVQNDERYETFEGYQELGHNLLTASAAVDGKTVTMQPVAGSVNALVPMTVINTRGPDLPVTGDDGVWMYGAVGLALVASAGFILFLALRKRKSSAGRK